MLYAQMRCLFPFVAVFKPKSSRVASMEHFIVCKGYAPPKDFDPDQLRQVLAQGVDAYLEAVDRGAAAAPDQGHQLVPFLASGDLTSWGAACALDP